MAFVLPQAILIILVSIRRAIKPMISCQNKHRSFEVFKDYYYAPLASLEQQPGFRQFRFRMKAKLFAPNSTTISLCLSLFDWAKYKRAKGTASIYALLDYDSHLAAYVNITDGKTKTMHRINFKPTAFKNERKSFRALLISNNEFYFDDESFYTVNSQSSKAIFNLPTLPHWAKHLHK